MGVGGHYKIHEQRPDEDTRSRTKNGDIAVGNLKNTVVIAPEQRGGRGGCIRGTISFVSLPTVRHNRKNQRMKSGDEGPVEQHGTGYEKGTRHHLQETTVDSVDFLSVVARHVHEVVADKYCTRNEAQ